MRTNPDYTRKLLKAFLDASGPTTDIEELQAAGVDWDDPLFEFHMRLLYDDGDLESTIDSGIGLSAGMWSVIPLRLTANGQRFAEALQNGKVLDFVKKNFAEASMAALKHLALKAFSHEVDSLSSGYL